MHVLMFGWEFPPRMSGGLGTACYGMTRALANLGQRITFVLPRDAESAGASFVELLSASHFLPARSGPEAGEETAVPGLALCPVATPLSPYLNAESYREACGSSKRRCGDAAPVYGRDLIAEVARYGRAGSAIAKDLRFDIIHAHDWMTVPAALNARRLSGKPLVLHVHSLEYDRSGENPNEAIRRIEGEGFAQADRLIAVSHRTKRMIVERYGIEPEKISVVHNAVSQKEARWAYGSERHEQGRKRPTVLFLGRITFQKGPDYFVEAAARVLEVLPETRFVMAGSGDMMPRMIERVAALGMGDRFRFTGFLQGEEIERIFSLSDLYVMPSVSEPFGISPLEAILYDVPVIISRQSGVAEILRHALKVDFWDVRELAGKIIAVLKHPCLAGEMTEKAREELRTIRWERAAERILEVYRGTLAAADGLPGGKPLAIRPRACPGDAPHPALFPCAPEGPPCLVPAEAGARTTAAPPQNQPDFPVALGS